ncbi:MAG: class I SAM-dependent methyltransferase, partial [Bacteroidales bacterium]|nr:class I SAM-dependent methyltransferase [Bacteroidales bacterium]
NDGQKVLEIGFSGISAYQKEIRKNFELDWFTLELVDSPNNKPLEQNHFQSTNEYSFPIAENYFDIVISGQVLEHVKKPWVWLNELKRIVKPGGHIITINPISWHYHEDPVDCWRIYPEGIKALSEECELDFEFCLWESLEWDQFNFKEKYLKVPNFTMPGKSIADENGKVYTFNKQKYIINRFLVKLPFLRRFLSSIQLSYDTISILKKP